VLGQFLALSCPERRQTRGVLFDELVEKGLFRTVTWVTVNALARANFLTRQGQHDRFLA
jgi:hypothetical protein